MKQRTFNSILILVGAGALIPGGLEILFTLTGKTFIWGKIAFQGEFMFWRGVVLLASGVFYLTAVYHPSRTEKRAQAVLASLMIWIVGGMEILSVILSSIPGDGGRWFNSTHGFLSSYTGPFIPAIFLLPISLLLVFLIFGEERKNEG